MSPTDSPEEDAAHGKEGGAEANSGTEDGAPALDCIRAVAPLGQSNSGGSGSFRIRADDGREYWCKVLNNTQNEPLVPINEQIVARLGQLIGVAVCEPQLTEIPSDLDGWEFRPGHTLQQGYAHCGLAVEGAIETHALEHRADDENAVRQAGFFALHDWLGGADPQWLRSTTDNNACFSHDHGHYLWGPAWTKDSLEQKVHDAAPLGQDPASLDADEIERLASRLEALSREDIATALANLPEGWPINAEAKEAVVDFAFGRRQAVADRLRAMVV